MLVRALFAAKDGSRAIFGRSDFHADVRASAPFLRTPDLLARGDVSRVVGLSVLPICVAVAFVNVRSQRRTDRLCGAERKWLQLRSVASAIASMNASSRAPRFFAQSAHSFAVLR